MSTKENNGLSGPGPEKKVDLDVIGKVLPFTRSGDTETAGLYEEGNDLERTDFLCLTLGWDTAPAKDEMIVECLRYLDIDWVGRYLNLDSDDCEINVDAAEKELRSNGKIDDPYVFTDDGKGEELWYIECKDKEELSSKQASERLEKLFKGNLCARHETYIDFGQTPLTPSGYGKGIECTKLMQLKDYLMFLASRSSVVAHSRWEGYVVCFTGEQDCSNELEEYFFFQVDCQKYLLTYKSTFTIG